MLCRKPLPPTPSPARRGGASQPASLLLPLSAAGRGFRQSSSSRVGRVIQGSSIRAGAGILRLRRDEAGLWVDEERPVPLLASGACSDFARRVTWEKLPSNTGGADVRRSLTVDRQATGRPGAGADARVCQPGADQ